jgi:hypothetical protein
MKKILLFSLLLLSLTMFSQTTFVKKYTSMVAKKENIKQPWEEIDLTVVFNPNNSKEIVFYYSNGNTRTFYQTANAEEGKTKSGQEYQIVDCVDQDGTEVSIQLFDDNTCLRVIVAKGYTVEFYNN